MTEIANNTGVEIGDHVRVDGGFETGLTGRVTEVDLSGDVKPWPRFAIVTDGGNPEQRKRVGGLSAANLEKLGPDAWTEDTGYWEDSARSWLATMSTPDTHHPLDQAPTVPVELCELRIRDESTSTTAPGDGFSWKATRVTDSSLVDRGFAASLEAAQGDAVRAVVRHGRRRA